MFWNGSTAIEGLSGSAKRGSGLVAVAAHIKPKHAHRPGDVFEVLVAKIDEIVFQLITHLFVGRIREANATGLRDPFQSRGDIDAVAHEVAIALFDNVAEVNADAEIDAVVGGHANVAFDHAILHLDRTAHGVDHAAKFDEAAVAGALDDAPMMGGDRGINQLATQSPQPRQCAILICPRETAIAYDIRNQDRRDFPRFRHGASSDVSQISTIVRGRRRL